MYRPQGNNLWVDQSSFSIISQEIECGCWTRSARSWETVVWTLSSHFKWGQMHCHGIGVLNLRGQSYNTFPCDLYMTRAFHFPPHSAFSRFSELIPCHGMWITKQCHFSPIKTAFSVSAQEIKLLKYLGEPKKTKAFNPLSYWGLKDLPWWKDYKSGLTIELWSYLTHIMAETMSKKTRIAISMIYWWFFCQNRGQILSKLNSETTFGILSSRQTFQTEGEPRRTKMKPGLKLHFRLP